MSYNGLMNYLGFKAGDLVSYKENTIIYLCLDDKAIPVPNSRSGEEDTPIEFALEAIILYVKDRKNVDCIGKKYPIWFGGPRNKRYWNDYRKLN